MTNAIGLASLKRLFLQKERGEKRKSSLKWLGCHVKFNSQVETSQIWDVQAHYYEEKTWATEDFFF